MKFVKKGHTTGRPAADPEDLIQNDCLFIMGCIQANLRPVCQALSTAWIKQSVCGGHKEYYIV